MPSSRLDRSPCLPLHTTRLGDIPNAQTRRVTRENTPLVRLGVEEAKEVAFDLDRFDDGFNDQISGGDGFATKEEWSVPGCRKGIDMERVSE